MKFSMNKKSEVTQFIDTVKKRVKYVNKQTANRCLNYLKTYTPVRTGTLVNGYYLVQHSEYNISIKNDVKYIWYVNNGTIKQRGQHFIQLSLQMTKADLYQITVYAKNIN